MRRVSQRDVGHRRRIRAASRWAEGSDLVYEGVVVMMAGANAFIFRTEYKDSAGRGGIESILMVNAWLLEKGK